jgi:predicted dehydrogenase
MPLNCAVVGLGWWGRRVIEELADSEVIAVVTAVDPSADARAWAAARGISVYATLDEALVDGGFGGVIITSPHREHAAQIEAALSAGHHVFSEKPFTTDTASAQRVLEMAQRYGRVVGIGHERRFEPPIKDVRDAVASGRLGTPLVLEATFSHDKFLSLPPDNWRLSPVDAPVGPLSATGIHLMDLSIAIFGWPREVWANLNSDVAPLANGAALAVGIGFAGGGSALISAILSTPFAMRLCLYGTHGWVDIRDRTHPEAPTGWDVMARWRGDDEPSVTFVPTARAVRDNLESWGIAASGGASYPVSPEEILANVTTFSAITEAALSGTTVAIPR